MKDIIGYFYYYLFLAILILVGFLSGDLEVKASTSWSVNQSRIVTDFNGSYTYSSWSTQSGAYTPTDPVVGLQYRLKVNGGAIADNSYVFRVAYKPTPDTLYSSAPVLVDSNGDPRSDYVCTNFNYNTSDGYYKSTCTFTPQTNMSTSDYLYVRIWFDGGGSYVSSLAIGLSDYDLRQGTGAIITDMGNEIINNQNQNTQNIIDNNNANTQAIIDANKTCYTNVASDYVKYKKGCYINSSGGVSSSENWSCTDYVNVEGLYILTTNNTSSRYFCFYDKNHTLISCTALSNLAFGSVSLPTGTKYFRASAASSSMNPKFAYQYCITRDEQNTNAINDLDDSINNDDIDDPDDFFDDFNDMLPTNNTISSLIALPITLYTKILGGISGTCASINLGNLYGTDLILPCVNIGNYLGSTLWGLIDTIFSGMTIYYISKKMIKAFNNFTSLKEGDVIDG